MNVIKIYVNCGSRNECCSVYKVEIISLAFKWLIVLRSAMKKRTIKCTESLEMCLLCPKTCKKRMFTVHV